MLRMVGAPWTIVCLELPTSGGNMLRMVGDPFPSKGGLFAMLTAVGPIPY